MATPEAPPFRHFLAPRYWPTWLGIGLLCLAAWSPYRARLAAGRLLGLLAFSLGKERRYITRTNIRLCFPELDAGGQEALVRKAFASSGIGLVETATGWIRHPRHFQDKVAITGLDELLAARAEGRGVLMLGAHYSTLDFAANLLSLSCPFAVTYRPHKNPLFDAFMQRGRLRNCNGVFDRDDVRGAFRHLKKGEVLWYAPDQDYGPHHAVYAPFFGKPAATITTPSRFAAFNDSAVVMVRHHRKEGEDAYELEFRRLREPYPTGDDVADATLINRKIEESIRLFPDQYLWMHKRFKTQPGGKPESPYIDVAAPVRRIRPDQLDILCAGAQVLEEEKGEAGALLLAEGLHLSFFPGLPGRLPPRRHPAQRFERNSRALRLAGFGAATVDSLFPIPAQARTAVTWHRPPGDSLLDWGRGPRAQIPLLPLARFLAGLHGAGFAPTVLRLDGILFDGHSFSLLNPQELRVHPAALAPHQRSANLELLFQALGGQGGDAGLRLFCEEYARAAGLAGAEDFKRGLFQAAKPYLRTRTAGDAS